MSYRIKGELGKRMINRKITDIISWGHNIFGSVEFTLDRENTINKIRQLGLTVEVIN
jgi:hypothetical protein